MFNFTRRRVAAASLDYRLAAVARDITTIWRPLLTTIDRPELNDQAQKVLGAVEKLRRDLALPPPVDDDDTRPIPVFDGEADS